MAHSDKVIAFKKGRYHRETEFARQARSLKKKQRTSNIERSTAKKVLSD